MTDYPVDSTLYLLFTTRSFSTGAPTQLAGTPVVSAYENDSLTQITAGITLGVDHDSITGLNLLTIAATAANGYENGKDYGLVITTGTVGGVSVVGEVVGAFTIGRSAAAVDLANGTDGLGAIKAETAAILDDTDLIDDGTSGLAKIATDIAAVLVDTSTTLQAELDGIQADTEDIQTKIGTPAGVSVSADVAAVKAETAAIVNDTDVIDDATSGLVKIAQDVAAILVDTAEIGTAGAGLTNINLPNQTMDITGNLSGSVGSVTGLTASNLDTTVSSRASQTTADAIETDTQDIQSRLPAALSGAGNIKADMLEMTGGDSGAVDRLKRAANTEVLGTCDTGSSTTAIIASALAPASAVNDQFNGRIMIFDKDTTTANLRGQATPITDYVHATLTFTVTALTTAPASGDTFVIV